MTYLVDTSVLTRLDKSLVRAAVDAVAAEHTMARTTITDLELGFSARSGTEWQAIRDALDTFASIDVEPHHLRRAGQVQHLLADRALRGRKVPDLLIAAVAEDHGFTLLHYDADFDHIAGVTGQVTRWVVASGRVD